MNRSSVIINLDTSNSATTVVKVIHFGQTYIYQEVTDESKSQNVLPLIMKVLQVEKLTFLDITEIKVHPGPGSFTGVRVGVTVANTLGWVLGIPVNGKKIELPKYTQSKFD